MPEAVLEYSTSGNFQRVRKVQKAILRAYDEDFVKHASPSLLAKIRLLWNNIPTQLAKAERNLNAKSLRIFRDLFTPPVSYRTSLAERHVGKDVHDIPLYAIPQIVNDACSR